MRGLCGQGDRDISFELHEGEVLGVAGLVGSGVPNLPKCCTAICPGKKAKCASMEKLVHITSPQQAIRNGIGLIPEDRKREGVFLDYSIEWNIPHHVYPWHFEWAAAGSCKKYRTLFSDI